MRKHLLKTILAIPLLTSALFAILPPAEGLLAALDANARQIPAYRWKQKTTVVRKGDPMDPRIDAVRFDASGQVHRTTLIMPSEKKMGPLKARRAAEIKESVQAAMELAGRYAAPDQLAKTILRGIATDQPSSIWVKADSLIVPGDEVLLSVQKSSLLPRRVDVKTWHGKVPLAVALDFEPVPGGPVILSRMTVRIPEEDVVVTVETFDIERSTF